VGAALAAPASADSAAKAKSKFTESRRFIKKKFEPTFFAMIDKSWQLFFARAIYFILNYNLVDHNSNSFSLC